jgi:hypothetical protein
VIPETSTEEVPTPGVTQNQQTDPMAQLQTMFRDIDGSGLSTRVYLNKYYHDTSTVSQGTQREDIEISLVKSDDGTPRLSVYTDKLSTDFVLDEYETITIGDTEYIKYYVEGRENPALWMVFRIFGGTPDDYKNGTAKTSYHIPFNFVEPQFDQDGVLDALDEQYASGVFGIPTPVSDLPNDIATFSGTWMGHRELTETAKWNRFKMDADLKANFIAETFTGRLSNYHYFQSEGDDWTPFDQFELIVDPKRLSGGEITTTMHIDPSTCAAPCPVVTHSEMNVEFFGPNAQELGGQAILGLDTTGNGRVDELYNGFISAKQR